MNVRQTFTFITAFAALIIAAGCTLGPEPERPATAADISETYAHASDARQEPAPEVSPWWREFGDQTTTELVELALANNTDLHVAAARVLEAEAGLRRAGGARLPQVGYGLNGSKQRISFVLPQIGRQTIDSTTYSYSFNVAWQADLFGRLPSQVQARGHAHRVEPGRPLRRQRGSM